MNAAMTVGLPGPAPPATATPSSASGTAGDAAPFTHVLHQAGLSRPGVRRSGDGASTADPGSLDVATLVQLLLGQEAPPGNRTDEQTGIQPDRPAGAGTTPTEDASALVNGELLVALMAPPAEALAEPHVALPAIAQALAAASGRPDDTGSRPNAVKQDLAQGLLNGSSIETPSGDRSADAPRVVLPSAAADAPRAAAAPVAMPDGEQQSATPLNAGPAANGDPLVTVEQGTATSSQAAPAEPSTTVGDDGVLSAKPAVAATTVTDLVEPTTVDQPVETRVATSDQSAVPATADAVDAPLQPMSQPVTSTSRALEAPAVAETAAAAPTNEAFSAELASTVRRASLLGDSEVRLLLNPPELGHLDIRVIEAPEGLRVVLEATSAEARELIEQQLPALRNALEARDLKVERLSVEQALDASGTEEQSERGLRQDGQGDSGSGEAGSDAPWSPVASIEGARGDGPEAHGTSEVGESTTRTSTGDGRLDVLA